MVELDVVGVRIDGQTGSPVLLLKDQESNKYLPIWIGAAEASAIVDALEGNVPPRPLTHDLFADVLDSLGLDEVKVTITSMSDGVFFAELEIGDQVLSARPSDAIALALRLQADVWCLPELLAEVGVELADETQDEVEAFREFLDTVNADDFKDPMA